MNHHHERFVAWLEDGAPGEPARDLAVHATGCEACLESIGAFDELAAVDIGAIRPNASMAPRPIETRGGGHTRIVAAGATLGATLIVVALVSAALLGRESGLGFAFPSPEPSEGTLAGNPDADGTPGSSSSAVAATASASAEPSLRSPDAGSSPAVAGGTGGTPIGQPWTGPTGATGSPTPPSVGGVAPPASGSGATPVPLPPGPVPFPTLAPTPSPSPPPPPPPTPAPTVAPPPPTPVPTVAPPPPTPAPTAEPTPTPLLPTDPCVIDPLDPICDPIFGRPAS